MCGVAQQLLGMGGMAFHVEVVRLLSTAEGVEGGAHVMLSVGQIRMAMRIDIFRRRVLRDREAAAGDQPHGRGTAKNKLTSVHVKILQRQTVNTLARCRERETAL